MFNFRTFYVINLPSVSTFSKRSNQTDICRIRYPLVSLQVDWSFDATRVAHVFASFGSVAIKLEHCLYFACNKKKRENKYQTSEKELYVCPDMQTWSNDFPFIFSFENSIEHTVFLCKSIVFEMSPMNPIFHQINEIHLEQYSNINSTNTFTKWNEFAATFFIVFFSQRNR